MSSSPRHRDASACDHEARTEQRAGVVRVTTFLAEAGQVSALLQAAEENARAARRAAGCLSAEVCTEPDGPETVLVISRWESASAVGAFLGWHERQAHGAVSPYTVERPHSVHYPVARPSPVRARTGRPPNEA